MELERNLTQLNTENYPRWKFEIEAILEAKDCSDVVNGETPCPSAGDAKIGAWRKRDALARSIISRSLDDFHHAFIRSCRTSREMMDSIICIKEQATVSNKLLVSSEFHAYRWKADMNVASFVAGLNAIVNKMESLKIDMDDASIVGKAVQCLPPQFDNFRESWRLSAPRFAKLTDLTSQLLACESDQVSRSLQTQISTGEALVGRKVDSPSRNVNNKSKYKDVVCWNCKKKGHTRSECRSNKWVSSCPKDSKGKQTSRGGFVVRNVDIHQERNDGWIADSGAFKHITRNRHWFSTFKDTKPCGVRVGNDKLLYAVGIGTIEVEVYDGMSWTPSTLNNVLYVPEFGSSCLFSLGAAAARGYTVTIRAEKVCLKKDGKAELIGYKDGDLYTLLIRRPSSDFSTPAVFVGPERLSLEELWSQTDKKKDETQSYLDDTSDEQNNVEFERGLNMPPGSKVKEKFNMQDCKAVACPWESSMKLSKEMSPTTPVESKEMSRIPYKAAVGSLMFLMTSSRPDISFETSKVSQFSENPGPAHWKAVKRILRYIKGTKELRLVFRSKSQGDKRQEGIKCDSLQLTAFCDSDWADDIDSRRSTSGYVLILCGGPVSWSTRVQRGIAQSTVEAEYVAISEATKEIKWFRQLLLDLGRDQRKPTYLLSDNQGAICLTTNPQFHRRTKHTDMRYHFIRAEQENGSITMDYISGHEQPADMLTKGLPLRRHLRCRQMIGINADLSA
uniref:CCHC-type domain-containing protein n=1 Tax=Trichuris muris TaxID=70415 RepID=A0A5S6QEJ0_TRIMR